MRLRNIPKDFPIDEHITLPVVPVGVERRISRTGNKDGIPHSTGRALQALADMQLSGAFFRKEINHYAQIIVPADKCAAVREGTREATRFENIPGLVEPVRFEP